MQAHRPPERGARVTPATKRGAHHSVASVQLDAAAEAVLDDELMSAVEAAVYRHDVAAPAGTLKSSWMNSRQQSDILEPLEGMTARQLRNAMVDIRLTRGQVLYGQDDYEDKLYLIVSGVMKLARGGGTDRQRVLFLLGPGETCGESEVLGFSRRSTSAAAVTDVTLLELPVQRLLPLLHSPDLALIFLRLASRRLERAFGALSDLTVGDTATRLAKVLVGLAENLGELRAGGTLLEHGLTQAELAELVGTSRETINKVLADFALHGWIEPSSGAMLITDMTGLLGRGRPPVNSSVRKARDPRHHADLKVGDKGAGFANG